MVILARAVAFLILVIALVFLMRPNWIKKVIGYWLQGKRIYFGGIIRIVCGLILLFASPQCRIFPVVVILGALFVASGILLFVLGIERVKKLLLWWEGKSVLFFRIWILFAIGLGALLLFSI